MPAALRLLIFLFVGKKETARKYTVTALLYPLQEMFGQVGGPATFTSGYQGGRLRAAPCLSLCATVVSRRLTRTRSSASAASSSSSFMQEGKAQMRMGMMTMSGF